MTQHDPSPRRAGRAAVVAVLALALALVALALAVITAAAVFGRPARPARVPVPACIRVRGGGMPCPMAHPVTSRPRRARLGTMTRPETWADPDGVRLEIRSPAGPLTACPLGDLPEGEVIRWRRPGEVLSDGLDIPETGFRLVVEQLYP